MTGPIDLSRIPAPNVVEVLDYETIYNQMRSELIALDPSLQDMLALESEPLVKQLQICAYRELLLRQRVNDAARAVMIAYAIESDLDNLGALFRVFRLQTSPGDPAAMPPIAPTWESDDDYRQRILLGLDGFSTAGPARAYIYHALSASGQVLDASIEAPHFSYASITPAVAAQLPPGCIVLQVNYSAGLANPMPGDVVVTALARTGDGSPSSELLATVHASLNADAVRPITDNVHTRGAAIIGYAINATLITYAGPDSDVVLAEARRSARQYADENHRLGRAITLSGIYAALHVAGVQKVVLHTPVAEINCTPGEAAYCTAINLTHGGLA